MLSNISSIGKIKLTASFKDYENLILWQPNESFKYIPINVSSAERTSYNLQYLKEFPRLQMQLTYNHYDSLDKDMDEKLLYVPDSSASLLLIFKQNNSTSYSINYKLTGDRILQYGSDWANTVKDETFGLVSFGLSKNIAFGGNQNMVKANLAIDNLLDEVYISTIGYPEPGRSMNLTIEYQL